MKKPDVIIILGGGTDGTLNPILYTKERVEAFVDLYPQYLRTPIIVSGGYSMWAKRNPKYKEADVMKNYLIKHGVPEKLINVEKRSRDTLGNAYFSKLIVNKFPTWKKILIITTKGHERRSAWSFNKAFGSSYKIGFIGVVSQLPTFKNNPNRKKYERYIQKYISEKYFEKCKDGDDKGFWKVMQSCHPAHSRTKEAKILKKKIMEAKTKFLGYVELKSERTKKQ